MKCLLRYEWVKLLRACLPEGKGILGHWAKLASRAAFRKGQARYCGHTNHVESGDVVWRSCRVKEYSWREKPRRSIEDHGYASGTGIHHIYAGYGHKEAGVCHAGLGSAVLWDRVHGRKCLCDRRIRVFVPTPQYSAASGRL